MVRTSCQDSFLPGKWGHHFPFIFSFPTGFGADCKTRDGGGVAGNGERRTDDRKRIGWEKWVDTDNIDDEDATERAGCRQDFGVNGGLCMGK